MLSNVPTELIFKIVDDYIHDLPTLQNCSLASTVFLVPCQSKIFKEVRLDAPFVDLTGPKFTGNRMSTRCANLYAILDNNSSIGSYIRNMTIVEGEEVSKGELKWITTDPILPKVLRQLDNLVTFRLTSRRYRPIDLFKLQWDKISEELRSGLSFVFTRPSLESLTFEGRLYFQNTVDFWSMFPGVPPLKRLKVSAIYSTLDSSNRAKVRSGNSMAPTYLEELDFDYTSATMGNAYNSLLVGPNSGPISGRRLSALSINDIDDYQQDPWIDKLLHAQEDIHRLNTLVLGDFALHLESQQLYPAFRSLPSISSLTLSYEKPLGVDVDPWSRLSRLLPGAAFTPLLKDVTISLQGYRRICEQKAGELARVFSPECMPKLKTLKFKLKRMPNWVSRNDPRTKTIETFGEWLKEVFDGLDGKGILDVEILND